jgi:hypothetical protein
MARPALPRLLPALLLLAAAACGGESARPDGGTPTPPVDAGETPAADSGVHPPPDAGVVDSGPRDCSANPFRCAPMQAMDASCVCLESCLGGLRWNAATGMCEAPPAGECAVNSDCDPGAVCLNVPANAPFAPCLGEATCRCMVECDPWVRAPQSGCPPDLDFGNGRVPVACTWLGEAADVPEALCLPAGSGGEHGAACADGTACNRNKNYFCAGRTANRTTGACAHLCDTGRSDEVCLGLGEELRCVALGDEAAPQLGFCAQPPVADVGTTCTSSVSCMGGVCSTVLGGSCTQGCGGLALCAADGLCISFTGGVPPGEEDICMQRCASPDAAGDQECAARNPNTICRALLTTGPALCAPPCTVSIGCPTGRTCDPQSGRCM